MVKGPAKVEILGRCWAVGCKVSGKAVLIRPGKALPFEPAQGCRLYIRLGRGGRMWWASSSSAGMSMWHSFSQRMLSMLPDRDDSLIVLVVGSTDAGKSTLCAYLANEVLRAGYLPCVIDGDIGQGDLAPPAAVGAAVLTEQITDLREVAATVYEFIGTISPSGSERFISDRLYSILSMSSRLAQVCIVNTDGYVNDGGIWYKRLIADTLQPDMVVCLGRDEELFDALASGAWEIQRVRASTEAYKSRTERTMRRQDQFLRFVGDGLATVDRTSISFVYMGKSYSSSELQDSVISDILRPENLAMMFVGLGSNNKISGFGVIVDIGLSEVRIRTDVTGFNEVYLSNVRLEENGARSIMPA